jgi:YidC/Oxa1 family membrane protein insertase
MVVAANIFQPLIDVFEAVLKFFHNTIGVPWGWSIVLLTLLMRAVLVPLTLKQFHSMRHMQQHMPELKVLQSKYKDDKQRQQQEMMKFYKENEINPFASCLPLVAQLPVFISLFYMLRTDLRVNICPTRQPGYNPDLHKIVHAAGTVAHTKPCGPHGGAGFLFIQDLTSTAHGATLIALIVLYVATQLGSTVMMQMMSPQMDKTQRQMMMVLPLLFVIFVINFPAGLLVYWITTNAWTMLQQYAFKVRIGPAQPAGGAALAANGSGDTGGIGALLRRARGEDEPVKAATGGSKGPAAAPPPPPRKKKKRSGRRR